MKLLLQQHALFIDKQPGDEETEVKKILPLTFIFLGVISQGFAANDATRSSLKSVSSDTNALPSAKTVVNTLDNAPETASAEAATADSIAYYDQETGDFIEIRRIGPDSYLGFNYDRGTVTNFRVSP